MIQNNGNMRHGHDKDTGPRKVRHGIQLGNKEAPNGYSWLATKWLSRIEFHAGKTPCREGLEYAQSGQVASFKIEPGVVHAEVQGRAPRPYKTELRIDVIAQDSWTNVISLMASEAVHSAKLLGGEIPEVIELPFARAGEHLVPEDVPPSMMDCSCGSTLPCKHVLAMAMVLADRIHDQPLDAFLVRGIPGTQLLERLQEARLLRGGGIAQAHPAAAIPSFDVKFPPLSDCLDDFWRPGPQLDEFDRTPAGDHVSHALLRRLGPSPMQGRFPMVGLLASIYDSITASAQAMQQEIDQLGEVSEPAPEDEFDEE